MLITENLLSSPGYVVAHCLEMFTFTCEVMKKGVEVTQVTKSDPVTMQEYP